MTPSTRGPLIDAPIRYVPALDGVRGLAILLVFGLHFRFSWRFGYRPTTVIDHVFANVMGAGWIGVDLFFVLSGFLITCILLDAKGARDSARTFYVRRVLRLFPAYYLALLVLFVVVPAAGWAPAELKALLPYQGWYWTYLVNVFVVWFSGNLDLFQTIYFWSLSVEEHFYVLWPWIVLKGSDRTIQRVCFGAIAVAVGLRLLITLMGWSWMAAYYLMPTRMDSLALGALIATLARSQAGSALLRRFWRFALAVGTGVIVLVFATQYSYDFDAPIVIVLGYSANALASGAIIVAVLEGHFRVFQWRWLQRIGIVSYGAYVYHRLISNAAIPLGESLSKKRWLGFDLPAELLWMAGLTVVTLAVASLSYRWIESPLLRLKDRLAPRTGGEKVTLSPGTLRSSDTSSPS